MAFIGTFQVAGLLALLVGVVRMYEWSMPEVCPHVHTWRPCYPSLPSGELLTAFSDSEENQSESKLGGRIGTRLVTHKYIYVTPNDPEHIRF